MNGKLQRNRRLMAMALGLVLGAVSCASAALINLQAWVTYALLNSDGTTPLADGSIVQIIGSFDAVADPMAMVGTNTTGDVTGDDVVIATITIDSSILSSNGTFYSGDYYFESDDIKNMYIRFYDSPGPLTGLVYWGQSPVTNAEHHQFGGIFIDFVGNYATTNVDNFVVIPEPGTLNFILMWAGMLAAMRASMKKEHGKKNWKAPGTFTPVVRVEPYERF